MTSAVFCRQARQTASVLAPRLARQTRAPLPCLPTIASRRLYASSSSFDQQPAPPRLPPDQQAEFERLQRAAAESVAAAAAAAAATPSSPLATSRHVTQPEATVAAGTLSGGVRQGAPPEFEGEVNPKTGEVGGPKNEPLRWGAKGDWSYNGRVTDF